MRSLAAAVVLLAGLAAAARQASSPELILWAWERREDLRFARGASVAYLAKTLTLHGKRVIERPRLQPLLTAPGAKRIAVVRIETKQPALDNEQVSAVADRIAPLLRSEEEVQIDFDAAVSEREFYGLLLYELKVQSDTPISITALASWCMDDPWIRKLPIDDAVPMLFDMGRDGHRIRARLARGEDFRVARCRNSVGLSVDQPLERVPPRKRVWVFSAKPWDEQSWQRARELAR